MSEKEARRARTKTAVQLMDERRQQRIQRMKALYASMIACKTCSGKGYSGGTITEDDVCVTTPCPECRGICRMCKRNQMWAQSLCKECFFETQAVEHAR